LLAEGGRHIRQVCRGKQVLLVEDAAVATHAASLAGSLDAEGFQVARLTIPSGEESKSTAQLAAIWDRLGELRFGRDSIVIACGGGVIGDLVGFAAASWLRGVDFIQVPTTLLAMVDSSVGGKTGINHPTAKNLIGAFWQPKLVLADLGVLSTLPEGERISALAEIIKYGVIRDEVFFAWLEDHIERVGDLREAPRAIHRSCEIKAEVVTADERETSGLREFLNFGHTVGHAIENSAGYGTLRHGEAIAIGMLAESELALGRMPHWTQPLHDRLVRLVERARLPLRVPDAIPLRLADVQIAARSDKKNRAGTVRYMLPTRLGEVANVALTDEEVAPILLRYGVRP
jgi:3-dehydroquinate synthase